MSMIIVKYLISPDYFHMEGLFIKDHVMCLVTQSYRLQLKFYYDHTNF